MLLCLVAGWTAPGCLKTIEITGRSTSEWENNSADSVTLRVRVQHNKGMLVFGQYVNMALSRDSLNRSILVRTAMTNGVGVAAFNRLYPGTYFFNCFSTSLLYPGYASGKVSLFPQQVKDTVLILY